MTAPTYPVPPTTVACAGCGAHLAPTLRACPSCGRLVHAERLKALADEANAAAARGDVTAALTAWRLALDLLPDDSRQRRIIAAKIDDLGRLADATPNVTTGTPPQDPGNPSRSASGAAKALAGAGAVALLLWKFKFAVTFILTKGKLLLLGLTNASTLFSMLLSAGVYWTVWGWQFAVGLVLSIYVHEMGHVVALRRYGFQATAPMFLPGLGAVIRLQQHPQNAREDARIGLAGPIYGLFAAAASYGIYLATGRAIFAAVAEVGAWLNLFNLLPLGPLDGGRAYRALSRNQKWLACAALATAWFFSHESLLALLLVVAILHALVPTADADEGDPAATAQYIGLVGVLTLMCMIRVPVPA